MTQKKKVIIMIPTYEESENIKDLILSILLIDDVLDNYDCEIIVVDDNSPDGTAQIVKSINDGRVSVMVRDKDERGRGLAGRDGLCYALNAKADCIIEMDADFSHHPIFIPRLLNKLEHADLVLGSRYVKGGFEFGRPWYRRAITIMANFYIRSLFFINIRDCNSGFRGYNRAVLEAINPKTLNSKGPAIVQEILFRARKYHIAEVPIVFKERSKGESTLTFKKVLEGYIGVLKLRFRGD
jgi:dolichol-phosphate mannosyltransferase